MVEQEIKRLKRDGLTGSFTTFGYRLVDKLDVVGVKIDGEKKGVYQVKKNVIKYGTGGFRQEITARGESSGMSNIQDAIRQLAQGGRQTVSLVCTVDAVDKDARTVDCTPLDEGAPLLGVNLQANQGSKFGIVAFPRVGSYVV